MNNNRLQPLETQGSQTSAPQSLPQPKQDIAEAFNRWDASRRFLPSEPRCAGR